MVTLEQKIIGGIYGQALGDAFCMPSFLSPKQTKQKFGVLPSSFIAAFDDHPVHRGLRAGQVTDDTEQAMFLARQIIADGKVTLAGSAKAIVAWYDFIDGDKCIFVGPSTRRGVAKIRSGLDLNKTGLLGDTNGSAMRVSVVGLLHPGDVEAAAREAVITAIPTHNTGVACAAAAAVAGAVAMALKPNVELREVLQASIDAANIGEPLGDLALGASVARRIDFAISLAKDEIGTDDDRVQAIFDLVGTSLAASEAVPAAMGLVALANGDPMRAAQLAFQLSGDADTIGAMACAVCGAYSGVEAIPEAMRAQIRQSNPHYDFDAIAQGLYKLATAE